jgi:hypothetical protein
LSLRFAQAFLVAGDNSRPTTAFFGGIGDKNHLFHSPGIFPFATIFAIASFTAYAVWTSIGAVGTFTIGVLVFGDPNIPLRWLGVAFILLGVILLKMG